MRWMHVLLCVFVTSCRCFSNFQDRIPNGYNVSHPCNISEGWSGVGHQSPLGGGARNTFGVDFQKAGLRWTPELCKQDSDEDGRTNGEELGDPSCTWDVGSDPFGTVNISHPDVLTKDLRFTDINIPTGETAYYCMTFDLMSDKNYHIVADEPILDKGDVVEQILVTGCQNAYTVQATKPRPCLQEDREFCYPFIAVWRAGSAGSCHGDGVGFRIGRTGYQRVLLQIRYSNRGLVEGNTDSSGMRLYLQPAKTGVKDLRIITTGQALLEIPPGQSDVTRVGLCPTECFRTMMVNPTFVTRVTIHMNSLGKSMKLEVYRDGEQIQDLTKGEVYNYSAPTDYIYKPPFQLLPGDEIKTSCVYNSLSTDRYTYYGDTTADETCFAALTLYPKQALTSDSCVAFGSSSMCDLHAGSPIGQCNWEEFTNFVTNAKIVTDVMKSCNLDGFCRPECREVLRHLEKHPCLNDEAFKWVIYRLKDTVGGLQFLARLHSCPVPCIDQSTTQNNRVFAGGHGNMASSTSAMFLSSVLVFFVMTYHGILVY